MQPLSPASNSPTGDATAVRRCAHELMDAAPPVIWFIRRQMRTYRRGLSLPAFRTLVRVDQEPEACLSEVADFLGASLPTTSRIVGNLVDRGLLTRQPCSDDRRHLSLAITAKGRAMLEEGWSATESRMAEVLVGLSDEQRAVVTESMHILKGVFGSAGLDKPPQQPLANGSSNVARKRRSSAVLSK